MFSALRLNFGREFYVDQWQGLTLAADDEPHRVLVPWWLSSCRRVQRFGRETFGSLAGVANRLASMERKKWLGLLEVTLSKQRSWWRRSWRRKIFGAESWIDPCCRWSSKCRCCRFSFNRNGKQVEDDFPCHISLEASLETDWNFVTWSDSLLHDGKCATPFS